MKMREYKIITEYEDNLPKRLEKLSKERWEFVSVLRSRESEFFTNKLPKYWYVCLLSRVAKQITKQR